MRLLAVFGSLLLLIACSSSTGWKNDDEALGENALTNGGVTALVEERLTKLHADDRDRMWSITTGDLNSGGLLQVPNASTWGQRQIAAPSACPSPLANATCDLDLKLRRCKSTADCNGGGGRCAPLLASKKSDDDAASSLCVGHSDSLLDEIYGVMTSARSFLDITTLSEPTGRFLTTMRNAITTLDRRGKPLTIRILLGSIPGSASDGPALLTALTRDLSTSSKLEIAIGVYRMAETWNHSKIIAADGKEAIIGGMNLWEAHYLDAEPVHDVSLHVRGAIATSAQRYANELWDVLCKRDAMMIPELVAGLHGDFCLDNFPAPVSDSSGGGTTRMIGIGRMGIHFRNPSDTALVAMMDAAKTSIKIAQQDIGSVKIIGGVLPEAYLDAWTRAVRRNVDVTVIVSNEDSHGGEGRGSGDAYTNGWSTKDLWSGLVKRAKELWPNPENGMTIEERLCKHVRFATLRSSTAATWPSGAPLANHAKVVIIDDQAHYVGSQNLYKCDLAEYGVIVDDPTLTSRFVAEYYAKLAEFSLPSTYAPPACK